MRHPWLALAAVIAACDAPVYYPSEPDPRPEETGLPTGSPGGLPTGTPAGTTTTATVDGLPCSEESVTQAVLEVQNNSAGPVDFFWLDFSCSPIFLRTLFPGETTTEYGFVSHSFYLEDLAGSRVAEITLVDGTGQLLEAQ